mmetsp:Transcript_18247/g.43813  ORF Transcript_18247/g.43813 Transcript_18247/m.43813 type:complete len:210 (-) Transcript_18247:242-871(-)
MWMLKNLARALPSHTPTRYRSKILDSMSLAACLSIRIVRSASIWLTLPAPMRGATSCATLTLFSASVSIGSRRMSSLAVLDCGSASNFSTWTCSAIFLGPKSSVAWLALSRLNESCTNCIENVLVHLISITTDTYSCKRYKMMRMSTLWFCATVVSSITTFPWTGAPAPAARSSTRRSPTHSTSALSLSAMILWSGRSVVGTMSSSKMQ